MSDEWLSADTNGSDVNPDKLAEILGAIATTLREAPEGKQYDFELVIEEQ